MQRAHHGEVAGILLRQETGLLVLRCGEMLARGRGIVVWCGVPCSAVQAVNILLSVGTGASSLGLLGPFLRVAMASTVQRL